MSKFSQYPNISHQQWIDRCISVNRQLGFWYGYRFLHKLETHIIHIDIIILDLNDLAMYQLLLIVINMLMVLLVLTLYGHTVSSISYLYLLFGHGLVNGCCLDEGGGGCQERETFGSLQGVFCSVTDLSPVCYRFTKQTPKTDGTDICSCSL